MNYVRSYLRHLQFGEILQRELDFITIVIKEEQIV